MQLLPKQRPKRRTKRFNAGKLPILDDMMIIHVTTPDAGMQASLHRPLLVKEGRLNSPSLISKTLITLKS